MARVKERVNPMFAIEALIERLSDRRFDMRFGFRGDLDGTEVDDPYMQRQRSIQSTCRKLWTSTPQPNRMSCWCSTSLAISRGGRDAIPSIASSGANRSSRKKAEKAVLPGRLALR